MSSEALEVEMSMDLEGNSEEKSQDGGAPAIGITLQDDRSKAEGILFEQCYTVTKRLRAGSYGTVFVTRHLGSDQDLAVKILDRSKLKKKDDDAVFREVAVMKQLVDVPGVIRLMDFFVSPEKFYVVQEWAEGGDCFDKLAKRTTYTEKEARELSLRLLEVMEAMHSRSLVHRDLKPENILLKNKFDDTNIRVADFGFAKKVPEGRLKTRCGTPAFVAPEILVGSRYCEPVDMWSCGVILYILIGGYPPFQGVNHRELFRKIRAADYVFHEAYWQNVSVEAKQLISSLLTVNASHRFTAKQALQSSWMKMEDRSLSEHDLSSSLTEMKKFNARRALKSAMHAVSWAAKAQFFKTDNAGFNKQLEAWDKSFEKNQSQAKPRFHDVYDLKTKIRKGSFATVWECERKDTGERFAVKIIKREGLKPSEDEAVMNEVAVVRSLKHENIVQFVDFYEEPEYFFLVMELMTGGDVFDKIVEKTQYTEKDARDLIKALLKAVEYMHSMGVAHRDLKPQNLLIKNKEDDSDIKCADFGFARRVHTPQSLTTRCGTPTYVSPEILKNVPHDQATDMWSVGVILYVLLVGYPPFMEDNQHELFRKIRTGEYEFPKEDWSAISEEAIDLIKKLLKVDPLERLTAGGALRHPWILEADESLSSRELTESLKNIKQSRGRFKTIAKAVMWFSRDRSVSPTVVDNHAPRAVGSVPEEGSTETDFAAAATSEIV